MRGATRDALLLRGGPVDSLDSFHFAYRPFDNRWLYWEAETKTVRPKARAGLQSTCVP